MEIDQVNELFDLQIPESDEYSTIAGYILSHYQSLPKIGELIKNSSVQLPDPES